VADADTLVVAATHAWTEFEETGAYICQPLRSFRANVEYLGFDAKRQIYPVFPKIVAFRPNMMFTHETIEQQRATGGAQDAELLSSGVHPPLGAQSAIDNRGQLPQAHQRELTAGTPSRLRP
jgi:hypothetical protein